MFIESSEYRSIRYQLSILSYYWSIYKKNYPDNSSEVFIKLNLDVIGKEYRNAKNYVKIPFSKKVYIRRKDYDVLKYYANIALELMKSHKFEQPLKFNKKNEIL